MDEKEKKMSCKVKQDGPSGGRQRDEWEGKVENRGWKWGWEGK